MHCQRGPDDDECCRDARAVEPSRGDSGLARELRACDGGEFDFHATPWLHAVCPDDGVQALALADSARRPKERGPVDTSKDAATCAGMPSVARERAGYGSPNCQSRRDPPHLKELSAWHQSCNVVHQ